MSSPERPGRDDRQIALHLRLAHLHDRALAELLFDLRQRGGQRLALVVVHGVHSVGFGGVSGAGGGAHGGSDREVGNEPIMA